MKCSLSGKYSNQLVVVKTTGLVYDKDVLSRHLKLSKTCPVTGFSIEENDLIMIKNSDENRDLKERNLSSVVGELSDLQRQAENDLQKMRMRNSDLKKEIILLECQKREGLEKIGRMLKIRENLSKN